jgi:alkylation response protein AidB-like acyl-CoA dehydrogenase
MDLELTPEQVELRSLAADLLARRVPTEVPRDYLEGKGAADDLWRELAELGWYAVGLEDDDPFGVPGLCVLAEQVGRALAPTVLIDVATVARIVAGGGGAARSAWLERLRSGEALVSLAVSEPNGQWSRDGGETTAAPDGADGFRLDGTKTGVHHGAGVAAFGVVASLEGEPAFFLVGADSAGVDVTAEHGLDPTARVAHLVLERAAVGADCAIVGAEAIERAFAVGGTATAAESVGAASACLDLAVDYAQQREQFGHRIGEFQAVQHILAEAHALRETAWSAVLYAAAALDEETADAQEASTIAKAYVSRAARTIVESALQVFGGIGFTWEHDLHLYLRRVLACEQRFGDALFHEQRLGEQIAARADDRLVARTGRSN